MITVRLKDKGISLNFPNGMSQEEMRIAINKSFYPNKIVELESPEVPETDVIKPPSQIKEFAKGVGKEAFAQAEAVSSIAGGLLSFIPSMSAGFGELVRGFVQRGYPNKKDFEAAVKTQHEVAGIMGQPTTEKGRKYAEFIATPFTEWNKGWRMVPKEVFGIEGAEDAGGFIGDMMLAGAGAIPRIKGGIASVKTIPGQIKGTYWFNRLQGKDQARVFRAVRDGDVATVRTIEGLNELWKRGATEGERTSALNGLRKKLDKFEKGKPVEKAVKAPPEQLEKLQIEFQKKRLERVAGKEPITEPVKPPVEKPKFTLATQEGRIVEGRIPKQTTDLFIEKGFEEKLTPEEVKTQAEVMGDLPIERLEGEQKLPLKEEAIIKRIGKPVQQVKFDPDKHSLVTWIRIQGGMKAEGVDIQDITKIAPGLINKAGQDIDRLHQMAIDEGFLGEASDLNDFRNAIQQDISGKKVWSFARDVEKAISKQIEAYLGKEVDEAIGTISPPVGLSIKPIKGKPITPEYKFDTPEIEQRYKASKGVIREPFSARVRQTLLSLKHKATSEFEHLPKNKEFAQLRFDLLRLKKQKGVAGDRTVRALQGVTIGLDKNSYDLFTRKVILDDLAKTSEQGKDLPLGFNPETLIAEKSKLDMEVVNHPEVIEALRKRKILWDAIRNDYIKAQKAIGHDVSKKLQNDAYFRHQVLEYVNLRGLYGAGKKLKVPTARGFLKERKGSELDINTDYIQAEYEVMAQMLHDIEVARTIESVDKNYNIAPKLKQEWKLKNPEEKMGDKWKELIPEGHTTWQPREGNVFYFADSIPSKLSSQLTEGKLEEIGITVDDIRKALAMGSKRKEFVLKNEIADTLDNLSLPHSQNVISVANKKILRAWKIWTLISPRRFFKYNIRNLTGDADAAFVGNSSGFKFTLKAIDELHNTLMGDKAMTPELKDWFERGGMESTLQAQELGELNRLRMFLTLHEKKGTVAEIPLKAWNKYWKTARVTTDFREAILRYANYLDYLKQMKKSPDSMPDNFGASIPDEILGLENIKDRAFWLSNDLLGAYDRVSIMGTALREHIYPFWSWKEVNFKRYLRMWSNAANDGRLAGTIGKRFTKSPYTAYKIGKFLIKATAFWSFLQVWNNTVFPEEEKELDQETRSRPHIILGRDDDGKIINFTRIGALGDFLEWFGLDAAPQYVDKWFKGKMTLTEIGKDMAKSPVNVLAQGATPLVKVPAEVVTRRALFPDVFKPTTIRDRGFHIARSLGLENEYKEIAGLPSKPYSESLYGFVVYKTDPGQSAYRDVFEEKNRFLRKLGKLGEGFWITPKGEALYNFKLALRYGDKKGKARYFKEYLMLGGSEKGLKQSLMNMMPLSGLSQDEQTLFILQLSEDDRQKVVKALRFWSETLLGAENQKGE